MKRYLPFVIIAGVLVVAVVSATILLRKKAGGDEPTGGGTENSTPPAANGGAPNQATPTAEAPITKPNVKISSPVVLEEYGDYQCPPCGILYPELKKVESEYGDQLRIVFHHFPLAKMHKNAMAAAHAAEAARNQNKFWEMHDRLYRNQKAWADLDDARPIFISYAQQLGLKVDQFTRDMDSPQIDQRINADIEHATSVGVTGTPTVFIEGKMLKYENTNADGLRRGINLMLQRKAIP